MEKRKMVEGPYKLPKGWRWVPLRQCCAIYAGSPAPQDKKYFENGKFPFIRVSDLSGSISSRIKTSRDKINEKAIKDLSLKKANKGAILFPKSGAAILTNARAILDIDAYIVSHLAAIETIKEILVEDYIYWYLKIIDMANYIDNPSYPSLRLSKIKEIPVPIPPLEEQHCIVAKIDSLMERIKEARRLRSEALSSAEQIMQSALAEVFPRPGSKLSPGWYWQRLEAIAKVYSGSPAPQDDRYFENGTDHFIRVSDLSGLQDPILKTSKDKINELAIKELSLIKAKKGTIIFPKSGAAILTNNRAILGIDAYLVSHLAAVEPKPDILYGHYIYWYLRTIDMVNYIDNPSYPSLRLSKIRELQVPIPSLEKQIEISNYLNLLFENIKTLRTAAVSSDNQFRYLEQSILDKAFRGEL